MVIEICDRYLSRCNVTTGSRILDVGCGAGAHVYAFRESGYIHTLGIDPYIESDIEYENGALVKKCTIHDCGQEWDIIAFNHSFEHLPDPFETLQAVARLLAEDGVCLIRIPTVSSHAWRYYGADWVQLDAPRHFFLHSLESIKMLAAMSGLCMFISFSILLNSSLWEVKCTGVIYLFAPIPASFLLRRLIYTRAWRSN
jgi:SAM-dependent methyltransferase